MKKIYLTIALLFGLMTVSFGQNFGSTDGFFSNYYDSDRGTPGVDYPALPNAITPTNQDAGGNASLGSGLLLLTVLGGAYALRKRK